MYERGKQKSVLYDYFKQSAEVLLSEYKRSKQQKASKNIGTNREIFCNKFLTEVLPPRLSLKNGEIWDSFGNKTGEIDIIIIRDDAPALSFGQSNSFLVEGVFGAIEVKSKLDTTKLQEALRTLKKVKNLKLTSGGPVISSGPIMLRPLRIVFAYEGIGWEKILKELLTEENQDVIDIISILEEGVLFRQDLIKCNTNSPFCIINGKAASLAFLYYHLITYSTNFMGRVINIVKYLEPLNNWVE